MFTKLSYKIFYIILAILTFIFLLIIVFIIYIVPNLYHEYSLKRSEQYLDDLTYCLDGDSRCYEQLYFTDDYYFYIADSLGGFQVIQYAGSSFITTAYTKNEEFVAPDYEFTSQEIIIDGVSYTAYVEVKNIDTSIFKKFIVPLFIVITIIAIITSFIISRLFTKPIRIINEQIKELEDLNFNNNVHVQRCDELGEISNSLLKLNEVISLGISSLEAKKKSSDDFLKIMSHELKTPLTVVRGYNELLTMDNNLNKQQIDYLDISIDEIDKMTQLINNSIISSKLDSLEEVNNKTINLEELVQKEINVYSKIYPNVQISSELEHYEYRTNPDILKLAVKNIIENAYLHHTKNTLINVTLKDNYFEVTNLTTTNFNPKQIRGKDSKNLGVYIVVTALQLLGLKYQFTVVDNLVTFKIFLQKKSLK